MSANIMMPEMGEGVIEGTLIAWLKREGDPVRQDEAIAEIETDKVTVELASDVEGTLLKVLVEEGETVEVGRTLAIIGDPDEPVETEQETEEEAQPVLADADTGSPAQSPQEQPYTRKINGMRVSPVVARMAQKHDLDLNQIEGTGLDGRIVKRDVLDYLESQESIPDQDTIPEETVTRAEAETAPLPPQVGEILPISAMRRSIAEHMVASKRTSPHVTTFFEFDFAAVAAHREAHKADFARDGVKLTFMPYIALATVEALKQHRIVNASWSDEGILLKREINLGIAVAISAGLIVPVIKNADAMNLLGLARAIHDLAERARHNRLQPHEVQGGTFTLTNHGASGSLMGTPIINQPQVGVLGIGLIEKRVKVVDDAIVIRPYAYISFSFDHRALDGAGADAFVTAIKEKIEHWPS